MASNTSATIQTNQTFSTSVVPLAVGVLNPSNTANATWDCGVGMVHATMTTVVTGSPASFTVLLEGTYDGNTWTTVATTTNVAGETQFGTGLVPFTNLRARCTAVSGGTNPTINVYATCSETPFTQTSGGTSPSVTVSQGANSGSAPGWRVTSGSLTPMTTLNAATSTATGTVADFSVAKHTYSFQLVASAGVTAGAVTLLGSVDNVTFTPLTSSTNTGNTSGVSLANGVVTFTAPSSMIASAVNAGVAIRYFRADVTTNMTGGSVTVKVMAT